MPSMRSADTIRRATEEEEKKNNKIRIENMLDSFIFEDDDWKEKKTNYVLIE